MKNAALDIPQGEEYIFGFDEVGRGCIAGPVVAAGVCYSAKSIEYLSNIPKGVLICDSKKLSEPQRMVSQQWLEGVPDLHCVVGISSVEEIQKLNILWASLFAMEKCFDQLQKKISLNSKHPHQLLVDGNILPKSFRSLPSPIQARAVVKGDAHHFVIAAASIIAKNFRDTLMQDLAKDFPQYGWQTNVGYPTPAHKAAVEFYGQTVWHRYL